jgi:hypothetical protein
MARHGTARHGTARHGIMGAVSQSPKDFFFDGNTENNETQTFWVFTGDTTPVDLFSRERKKGYFFLRRQKSQNISPQFSTTGENHCCFSFKRVGFK